METNTSTLSDVILAYWPVLVAAIMVSMFTTTVCRRIALRYGIVDRPDDWLKPHKHPVPYLGGVAVFLGWAAGLMVALIVFDNIHSVTDALPDRPALLTPMTLGILAASFAITLLGLFDDLRMATPRLKLIVQVVVAVGLMWIGVGDDSILIFVRASTLASVETEPWLVIAYSIPLTLLITVGACNATNLIDGLDGLCSGVLGIIAAGFLVIAVHLHLYGDWHPFDVLRVVITLATLGAALGFLPFNRNPAKIFLGDAGSMLLGLNAAILLLLFAKSSVPRLFLGAAMVFGLPLADMLLTLARRWRNQKPLMQGDRSHYYDQLVDRGMSVRRVVTISYLLAAFFALAGGLSLFVRTRYLVVVYFAVAILVAAAVKKFKMVRLEQSNRPSESSA